MDTAATLVLKENYTFLVADRGGGIGEGEEEIGSADFRCPQFKLTCQAQLPGFGDFF